MKVAIVGSQGVPAHYGGFESLVENIIGENKPAEVDYTIFCSSKDMKPIIPEYKGCRLKYVGLHANGAQSTPYDILSMCKCGGKGYDVVMVLGVSGCLFLPIFRLLYRKKLIINIDGLEHRRAKWGRFAKWMLRTSEAMAVRYADVVIADNKGIQDYVTETYHKPSQLIAYGGDHVLKDLPVDRKQEILQLYGVEAGKYAITVCRIEPENNCHIVLEAAAQSGYELVFIGNWNYSAYGIELKSKYSQYENIHILDAIYDSEILYVLRSNASIYIHGHSAGGTNPSLVESMFFGIPIVAFDVVYNKATTDYRAYYFKTVDDLVNTLNQTDLDGAPMLEIAKEKYTWKKIAAQYAALY